MEVRFMEEKIIKMINNYVATYPHSEGTGWKEPLVAFAAAGDPLFGELKKIVQPAHALPQDFLPAARSVITYFLPFRDPVAESNIAGRHCSRTWAVAYIETNRLISELNAYLQQQLEALGFEAEHLPATYNFDKKTLLSGWSHRSAAYIAGLGTFGINHMLITSKGCCGRIGSLVTDLELKPTPRPEEEYCLYKSDGSCGDCVERCVNEALFYDHLDKQQCYRMCLENNERLQGLESETDICGKCMVGVACSHIKP